MPPPPLPHILRGLQRGARGAARGGRGCFPAAPHGAATCRQGLLEPRNALVLDSQRGHMPAMIH